MSHGVALAVFAAAGPMLVAAAARRGDALELFGVVVFVTSVILVYLASTLYHAMPVGPAKSRCRTLDHVAIYLLIAGTYTPFTLGVLRGPWGWMLLLLIWLLAAAGVVVTLTAGPRSSRLGSALYIAMGWVILVAAHEVWARIPTAGIAWLVAGGVAYTAGVAFFLAHALRHAHLIWHLFVIAGTTCHAVAVALYATGA